MPPKVTGDELLAVEVEAIRRVLNSHADDLDSGPVLAELLTLLAAQALVIGSKVTAGVLYRITGNWNAAGTDSAVYVQGLSAGAYDSTGSILDSNGKAQAVNVDVAAGTWARIPIAFRSGTGANSFIIGDPDFNCTADGDNSQIIGGYNNKADGDDCEVIGGHDTELYGQRCKAYGSVGCTVDASCVKVTLINCDGFAPPAGTVGVTYTNNVPVGTGGGSIPFAYTIRASDVTSPASDIVIAIPQALSFGMVYIEKPPLAGMDPLAPSNYSGAPGYLTLPASISPALQAGYIVHVYYQEGTAQAAGDPALSFAYTQIGSGAWDVSGKKHAAAYLGLTSNTALVLSNASDGFVGTILVVNTTQNPLTCALPAGCFGPKNYQASLAAGERRMITATYAVGVWYFNSAIYYAQ